MNWWVLHNSVLLRSLELSSVMENTSHILHIFSNHLQIFCGKALDWTEIVLEIFRSIKLRFFDHVMKPFGVIFIDVACGVNKSICFHYLFLSSLTSLSEPPGPDFHSQMGKTEKSFGDNMSAADENEINSLHCATSC